MDSFDKRKESASSKDQETADPLKSAFGKRAPADKSTKYSQASAEDDPAEPPGEAFDDHFEALQTRLREEGKSDAEIQKEVAEAREHQDAESDVDDDNAVSPEDAEEVIRRAQHLREPGMIQVPADLGEASARSASFLRSVWKAGHKESIEQKLLDINKKINGLNHKAGRSINEFTIPVRKLLSLMPTIQPAVEKWTKSDDTAKTKIATSIATTCLGLLEELAKCGIPWKSVVTDSIKKVLQEPLHQGLNALGPDFYGKFQRYMERDIELPSSYQTSLAIRAMEPLTTIFTHAEKGDITEANKSLALVKACNAELVRANEIVGLKKSDHELPIGELEELLNRCSKEEESKRPIFIASQKVIWAALVFKEGYYDLATPLATQREIQTAYLPKTMEDRYQARLREYQNPIYDTEPFVPSTDDGTSPLGGGTQGQGQKNAPKSAAEVPSNSSNRSWNDASAEGLENISVPGPAFGNGITDLGKVVAVQELGRGHRAIVNIGTMNVPVYRCYPGGAFGRGVLEELSSVLPASAPFNIKKRSAVHVESLMAVVQVDTKSVSRAPITKVQVKWNSAKGGKDFVGAPDIEWVSRTDLANACGKEWTDRQLKILLSSWQRNLSYLAKMKAQGLHPETKTKLDKGLRATMPWLFPGPDEGPFSQSSFGGFTGRENDSTDHIKVEDTTF